MQILVLLLFFYSTNAFAGDERGNGGDVVVCNDIDGKVKSIELLDFYEARELRGIDYDLGPKTLDWPEKVKLVLQKRGVVAPVRRHWWGKLAKNFTSEALFKSGIVLQDIRDAKIKFFPRGCEIAQIAIQEEPIFPEDKRYIISKDLWDQLDNDNKAGLVLHEIIYREALLYGHKNSINVRYINSIWTKKGKSSYFLSQDNLNKLFRSVKFASAEHHGFAPLMYKCNRYPSGKPAIDWADPVDVREFNKPLVPSFLPAAPVNIKTPIGTITLRDQGSHTTCEDWFYGGQWEYNTQFDKSNQLVGIHYWKSISPSDGTLSALGKEVSFKVQPLNGRIGYFGIEYLSTPQQVATNAKGQVNVQGQTLNFAMNKQCKTINFWARLKPTRIEYMCDVTSNFQLKGHSGKLFERNPENFTSIIFGKDGIPLSCEGCIISEK